MSNDSSFEFMNQASAYEYDYEKNRYRYTPGYEAYLATHGSMRSPTPSKSQEEQDPSVELEAYLATHGSQTPSEEQESVVFKTQIFAPTEEFLPLVSSGNELPSLSPPHPSSTEPKKCACGCATELEKLKDRLDAMQIQIDTLFETLE